MELHVLTISRKPGGNPNHPFIDLSGAWLEKSGFFIGEKILVQAKKGNIQIRTIKFTDKEESNASFKLDQ